MGTERRGPNRVRTVLAALLVCCLVASACGGGSSGDTPQAATTAGNDSDSPGDRLTLTQIFDQEISQADADAVQLLAGRLIDDLGTDEAATDALLLAFEAGHEPAAIIDAIAESRLGGKGAIDGVQPANTKLGLVSASVKQAKATRQSLRHVRQADEVPLPVSALRDGLDKVPGTTGTIAILDFLARGYSPQQIVEAIIFGGFDGPPADPDMLAKTTFRRNNDGLTVPPTPEAETADSLVDDIVDGTEPENDELRLRFRGSMADGLRTADDVWEISAVLVDSVDFVAIVDESTTLEGRATFLAESSFVFSELSGAERSCLSITIEISQVEPSMTTFAGMTPNFEFVGSAENAGAWIDGPCPGGAAPEPEQVDTLPFTATLTELSVLTITMDFGEEPLVLTATLSDG